MTGSRVALVGGPMYDGLYELLPDDAEILVHADHPTLNREVAGLLQAGERLDLISTHSKYAPSQERWLLPLDGILPGEAIEQLAPRAVDLCRFKGELLSAPRNIDVRVLWYRSDHITVPPDTWADLLASEWVFGFPGRESGLFGTFFEIVVAHGGRLFDAALRPTMATTEAISAVETLCRLAARAPSGLTGWHYDQVDEALLSGEIELAALWPGGYKAITESPLYNVLRPAPYLAGTTSRVSYAGCHSWAIPRSCGDVNASIDLLLRLCSRRASVLETKSGAVCANPSILAEVEPIDDVDALRLQITRDTIAAGMITYPPLARFPELEDAGWGAINAALEGSRTPEETVEAIQSAAEEALQ